MFDLDLLLFFLRSPLISMDGNKPGHCKFISSEGSTFKAKTQARRQQIPHSLAVSWVFRTLILDLPIMSHKNEIFVLFWFIIT